MIAALAYHEMMAVLGVGDLHPGGARATEFLLSELAKGAPRAVLEIGAGTGLTTARMMKNGWQVTAIEPSEVLCRQSTRRCGVPPHRGSFESFDGHGVRYDAVLGESVFYALEPKATVEKLGGLLRPGGLLAFVDMLWTERASRDVVAFIHDQTKAAFGIAMAPRDVVTWRQWAAALRAGGFAEIATRIIEPSHREPEQRTRRAWLASGLLTRPWLVPLYLTYRSYRRLTWAPSEWLESRMTVWRRE